LQKKYHTPEFLRTLPHLRQRLPFNALLLRLRSQTILAVTDFFAQQGFVQTHPPIITSSDCEGAGEAFTIQPQKDTGSPKADSLGSASKQLFFNTPKYLTVSSQLHLEAMAQAVGKVWTLSPTFRAEKSDTTRHLSEFYMLEAELGFTEQLPEIMDVVEGMLKAVALQLQASEIGKELLLAYSGKYADEEQPIMTPQQLERRWAKLAKGPWPRVTYTEAINRLQEASRTCEVHFEFPPDFDSGLQAEHEKYLAHKIGDEGPVFITDYPRKQKPFYMTPSAEAQVDEPPTVACFDLLVPDVCEIVGGSMRDHVLERLLRSMRDQGIKLGKEYQARLEPDNQPALDDAPDVGNLDWYADLRRYGSVPHGGFGLGFDRLLCYLAGVSNIKDMVGFPRWYGRCDC
jgi:asparaginyl-tRNA synthetase